MYCSHGVVPGMPSLIDERVSSLADVQPAVALHLILTLAVQALFRSSKAHFLLDLAVENPFLVVADRYLAAVDDVTAADSDKIDISAQQKLQDGLRI